MVDVSSAFEDVLRGIGQARTRGAVLPSMEKLATELVREVQQQPDLLARELQEGLLDACRRLDRVSLAVTGLAWLGGGVPSVEQVIGELVSDARRELGICAYSITPGALSLLQHIREVVSQGVLATVMVNNFQGQTPDARAFLLKVAADFPERCRLRDFQSSDRRSELHAKVVVVDRSAALVGSANLSFHGMVSNHEMAVIVRGPSAEMIADRLDLLAKGPYVRDVTVESR